MVDQARADFNAKYRSGRIIGEGNFSIVKECTNRETGERLAVKCINKETLDPKERSNLVQEINILQDLCHPNIIKLWDVYDGNGPMCFLVMEYAEGGELFDRIIAKAYYTEAEAKKVVQVVAKVLHYCHSKGVTHRDLKPENLLYTDKTANSTIKIVDFGFAKLITLEETNLLTMCGTRGYYAPEIVRNLPYDSKCDVWSLGVITYILLCGFPPFYDENRAEEMRKEQQEPAAGETLSESSPCPMDHPWTFTSSVTSFVTSTSSYFRVYIPSMEDSVKFSGGAIAALVAMRYAKSVHSAGLVGLLSGLFAHSFYADVLRKKRRRRRRRRGDKWQEINEKKETEEREEEISF